MGYFIPKLHLDLRYLFTTVERNGHFPVAAGLIMAIFFTT